MTAIDISQLAPPTVIESLDFETIYAEHKAYFIALYPADQQAAVAAALTLESDPIVKILQNAAYRELVLRARYNDEAKSVLLAYATGADLDHIGATYFQGEQRLLVAAANLSAIPPVAAVYESDTDFRARLQIKPESWSTAGPTEAYKFFALTADGRVKDAGITSPEPGTTLVTVLSHEGHGVPSQPVLDAATLALNSDRVRPLCEEVLVVGAEVVEYAIFADLYLYQGAITNIVSAAAQAGLQAYADAHHRIGDDITVSGCMAAAFVAGVQRVVLNFVDDIVITDAQVGFCTSVNIRTYWAAP